MNRRTARARRIGGQATDRGAAAVELALVLPVLLLLVFGIVDFGRMLNAQITLTQAAREGARAESFGDAAGAAARVDEAARQLGPVTTEIDGDCPGDPDAVVLVSYDFSFVTPIGPLATVFGGTVTGDDVRLEGRGVMPCFDS